MLPHGFFKIKNGLRFIESLLEGLGLPYWLAPSVFLGELVAPVLLLLGFGTRIAGLTLALTMLGAITLAHMHELTLFSPQGGGWSIEINVLFLTNGLVLALLGPGRWSLSRGQGPFA
jgi:putative oxidoreductase